MAALNEDSVEKKLKTVNNTQESIQSLSLWIIHHKTHHAKIVELWMKVLKRSVHPSHRLTLFYLCNDVVQTCKKKKAQIYTSTFKEHLPEAARLVRDMSVKSKIERIFKIWQERGVYDSTFVTSLTGVLMGKQSKLSSKPSKHSGKGKNGKQMEAINANDPISPVASPYERPVKAATPELQPPEPPPEDNIDDSTRILAEFKPHEMVEQITAYRRQELEIQIKAKQMSHLRLDASSLEAVKQLKDRAHGNEFSGQFEDSCTKLEDLVKRQTQHLTDQKALLETLKTSETFYEAQYREARIVANAYKNFGARINNMKKKLDEMKKTMPKPESPILSPDVNAPSPENSPQFGGRSAFDYNASNSMLSFQGSNQQKAWNLNGKDNFGVLSNNMDNTDQDSPPLEAPSPEDSPTDLNLDGSESGNTSLDSRLASFMDRNHRNIETSQSIYTPPISKVLSSSHSKLSRMGDDDGNTTPLDDEAPTTPVQDEQSTPPPKKSISPPKKENPIDFLSRLISQTQKTPTTRTGAASFLDSLTMLSNIGKPSAQKTSPEPDNRGDPIATSLQPPWSWNSTTSDRSTVSIASQPSSPVSVSSQPPSPTTFSRPPPTMVPPPPIPPIALAHLQTSPPVSINLSVPPPPPPPFPLVSGSSLTFPIAPLFQQTSPGQKENWPEKGAGSMPPDHTSLNRSAAPSSVLMELTPSEGFDQISTNPPALAENKAMDPDAMEIVSDDDEELDALTRDSDPEMENDGHEEFASKLKEKTTLGQSQNMKSSVFIPNPERPNLMTLSMSDDISEDDMVADDSAKEESGVSTQWPMAKHHKSKKSRSRSRSREKSHKHKKKKKHKRKGSDEEDFDNDGRSAKKIGSRSSSRNSREGKYDRFDDRGKYDDKYGSDRGKKYDRFDDKKYSSGVSSRSDYKTSYPLKDARDPRSVEAYTQAFIQQYSQARFSSGSYGGGGSSSDPRRSSYNKY